jgi:two-component system sensor histidine kinase CreC
MIPRVRPETLIFVVIGVLELLIAFFAYREIVKVEDATTALREGYLNEITHAVASSVQLAVTATNFGQINFEQGFKSFEQMDPKGYYALGNRDKASLHLVIIDATGRVVYDSLKRWLGHDLSSYREVREALISGYGHSECHELDGEEMMSVVSPVFAEGEVVGAVMASKSDFVLKPVLHRFQDAARLVGLAAGAAILLLVLSLFIYFLKPIELWFAYTDLFKKGQLPARPNLRRTRLRSLGAAIDHIYDSLSHRSYIEDLVTCLSHEMRSPVAIIRSSAELMLKNAERTPEDTIHLEDMIRHSDRMANLITRVITVAGIEKKDYLKELKAFNFRFMIQEFVREYRSRAEERKMKITVDVPEDLVVYCDSHLLLAAIGSLIQNAMEHSPVGSTIELSAHEGPKKVEIQIRDHGTGIPDYAIDRIFEKHYSLPKETTNLKSSGLGLSFVREVAALHWGDIDIKNHPEGGVLAKLRIRRWDW